MTLTQLKYVDAVNRCKSFTKAAKELYVSQPTISTMIRDLEEELQIEIFHRDKKGLTLTSDGELLLQHIAIMLDQESAILDSFPASDTARPDSFCVSSQHYPIVSSVFCEFVEDRSAESYEYHLKVTTTTEILSDIAQGTSEIGILAINELNSKRLLHILEGDGLKFHALMNTKASVFLSATHPLAKKATLTIKELDPWPCFYYDQKDDVLPCFAEEIRLPDHHPKKVIYISDQFSAIDLFQKLNAYNIGTGIIPEIESLDGQLVSIPLEGWPSTTLGWVSKDREPSASASRFLELLEQRLQGLTF